MSQATTQHKKWTLGRSKVDKNPLKFEIFENSTEQKSRILGTVPNPVRDQISANTCGLLGDKSFCKSEVGETATRI